MVHIKLNQEMNDKIFLVVLILVVSMVFHLSKIINFLDWRFLFSEIILLALILSDKKRIIEQREKIKKITFVSSIVGISIYIFVYLDKNRVLHFFDWAFLITIIFFFYILVIKELKSTVIDNLKNLFEIIFYYIVLLCIVILFKDNTLKNIPQYLDMVHKNFTNSLIIINILPILFFTIRVSFKKIKKESDKNILYSEREGDGNKICDFINNKNVDFNVLGINGYFGDGKTFLIDNVSQKLEKNIEVIKIRCLLLEKEEIYSYISKQINKVLIKNFIFTGYSEKVKTSLIKGIDYNFFGGVTNLLIRESSNDDIENFKKAILHLEKKLVIIFDDIDRVDDPEKIDKILSFVSDFSDNNIRILLLYNLKNLIKINQKYTKNYIEKYIPIMMDITKIDCFDLIEYEIKNRNLNQKDFRFLFVSKKLENNLYYNDPKDTGRLSELKFRTDFRKLSLSNYDFNYFGNPRIVKNFFNETLYTINHNRFKIEERIIIAYTFLKHFYYEEFYEKIETDFSFKESYPIKLELENTDIILTLEEFDIIRDLIKIRGYIKNIKDYIDKDQVFFILNKKRIYFDKEDLNLGDNYHLNSYLEKLKISKLDSKEELEDKLNEIEKKVADKKVSIMESTKNNLMIYDYLNYYLNSFTDKNKSFERSETIKGSLKKLKFMGVDKYLSSDAQSYMQIIEVLNQKDRLNKNIFYNKFLEKNYLTEIKVMEILTTFNDHSRKEDFLDLILFREKNIITDKYIQAFYEGNINNIAISDFIIEQILENSYNIKTPLTIKQIKMNLENILKREYLRYIYMEDNYVNFKCLKSSLEKKFIVERELFSIPNVKRTLKKYIDFLEKMILIEEEITNTYVPTDERRVTSKWTSSYPEYIEIIKHLKTKEEKEKEIDKLCEKGTSFTELEQIYNYTIKK